MKKLAAALVALSPVAALAQTAAVALPDAQAPVAFGDWKTAVWTLVVLPLLAWVGAELKRWMVARRQTAEVNRDSSQRAHVESILLSLVDSIGAPAVQRILPDVVNAVDPRGPGGVEITKEEWAALEAHVAFELRALTTPETFDLIGKTIGLNAAVRWIATFILKRVFHAQSTAADPGVPTDPSAAFYGKIPEVTIDGQARDAG